MSIAEKIEKAAQRAHFWLALFLGGIVVVAGAGAGAVAWGYGFTDSYVKKKDYEESQKEFKSLQREHDRFGGILATISDDVKSVLEVQRQEAWRMHRFAVPESAPPDMGAPGFAPHGR